MALAVTFLEDLLRGVLQGLPPGSAYGLIAIGFVLAYKTSGVFNLAFGAQAYVSAALYFHARNEWGWSNLAAFVLAVLVVAPGLGLALERLIFRHLATDAVLAKLVIAIGLSIALPALFDLVVGFEPVAGRTPEGLLPGGAEVFYDPFGVYAFSRDELTALGFVVAAAVGLAVLFRSSALGLQMRAVVESPRMTELMGIRSDRVAACSWALSSAFAGLAGVLIAPRFNTLAAPDFFNLVVVGVAAAAVGRLVSIPGALAGGLGLGVLTSVLATFFPNLVDRFSFLGPVQENLTPAVPFVVLFALVTLWPALRTSPGRSDPLAGVDPPPPAPSTAVRGRGMTLFTWAFGAAFLGTVGLVVFTRADSSWLFLVTQAVIMATIFLSITVLTGFGGQISLCQGAFAATGGFTVFQLADRYDVPVLAGALLGAVAAAVLAGLLALPLVRLGRVWVAIATLAFAAFFDAVLVRMPFMGGGGTSLLQGTRVPRPVVGPWDLADDRAFLVLAVVVLVLAGVAVVLVREGTTGRTLRALRGSEVAARSIGISPVRMQVTAFGVSGFLAGLGGSMLSIHQENVNYATNFSPFAALFWLVLVVALGSRTVEGAVYAAAAFALVDRLVFKGALFEWVLRGEDRVPGFLPLDPQWRFVFFGLATINFARHPEGLIESGRVRAHAAIGRALERRRGRPPGPRTEATPAPAEATPEEVAL